MKKAFGNSKENGSALALVMITVLILAAMVAGLMSYSTSQTINRARYETYKDEFAATEVAINKAYAHVQHMIAFQTPNFTTQVAAMQKPTVEGIDFTKFTVTQLFNGTEAVTSGKWSGLTLNRIRYRVDVTAVKKGGSADRFADPGASVSENLEITYIPLYLFAIFYDPLMEIAPGADMDINGRVHANGDMYAQANTKLQFKQDVTVAGKVFHGRYSASGQANSDGVVSFTNGSAQADMLNNGTWLTSQVSNWANLALTRWNGKVKDSAMGVSPLSLPLPADVPNPHSIIDRAAASDSYALQQEKLENKAGLKIIRQTDGTIKGVDANGNNVALTYTKPDGTQGKIYTETSFYDAREEKTVNSIDVDLSLMRTKNILPPNGILYVSNENKTVSGVVQPGVVRLVNGSQLPTSTAVDGFSVATDDPLYIKGDYNTVNKTLAMVASDALNILSNSWNDTNAATYASRTASATTVNAVCMHGNVPSASDSGGTKHYSGGVENNFRLLENWAGKALNFSGSIVIMWNSQKAQGWWGKSNVYAAPDRHWSWDTGLGGINGPPGAPRVVELTKTEWKLTTS